MKLIVRCSPESSRRSENMMDEHLLQHMTVVVITDFGWRIITVMNSWCCCNRTVCIQYCWTKLYTTADLCSTSNSL